MYRMKLWALICKLTTSVIEEFESIASIHTEVIATFEIHLNLWNTPDELSAEL